VFLPVDTPRMTAEAIRRLGDACRDAAVPASSRPLPGAYVQAALPVLERRLARGQLALRDALAELDVAVVALEPGLLANVNSPEELAAL
jgi:molybdopterin-guanine dinucleotide biosynthesis protein A